MSIEVSLIYLKPKTPKHVQKKVYHPPDAAPVRRATAPLPLMVRAYVRVQYNNIDCVIHACLRTTVVVVVHSRCASE